VRTSECLVLQKPFELSALRHTIDAMVSRHAQNGSGDSPTA
jgi:hypothetical protein